MVESLPADAARPSIRRPLTWLTIAKFLVNMALRLVYPFNTDIAKGLGVSLDRVGRMQGLGELTGLISAGIGHQLDRGYYARWVTIGVGGAGVGALLLGVGGKLWVFGLGFALIACGVAVMTTSAHTWIGETVPYAERGRVVGIYEASWAVALLVGAPAAGVLIDHGSWWWPFAVIGVLVLAALPFVRRSLPRPARGRSTSASGSDVLGASLNVARSKIYWNRRVYASLSASSLLTLGAVVIFASYGAWLKDRHGFTTASVSALTLGLGVVELVGSGSVALFVDRIGKRRSVAGGAGLMAVAALCVMAAGNTRWLAAVGIVLFFGGFEFAYVSQISINSEVGGAARGRVIAVNAAIVTIARASGAALGTWLYVHSGMVAVAIVSVSCAFITMATTVATFD